MNFTNTHKRNANTHKRNANTQQKIQVPNKNKNTQ